MDEPIEIEEDILSSLITCKICKKVLEEPVSLPCAKIICSKHIIEKKDKNSIYTCFFCKKDHLIDMNELPINDEILKLISKKNKYLNIDLVNFGENNSLAKESCELLETTLNEARLLSNDSANYIHEYFSVLKNKIDQTKEEFIQKIEIKHEEIINQVICLENECKAKAEKKVDYFSEFINETENKLKKWNESLKLPDFTKDDEWKSMRFDAANEIQMIKDEMEIYMNDLLANKDYQFSPLVIKYDNNFGEFYVKKIVETGKINMVLNNFSSIKSDSLTYNDSNETIINDVPWIISTKLKLIEDKEYLAFFVEPKCGDDELKKNPIITKLILKIHQNEARKTNVEDKIRGGHIFNDSKGSGTNNFCSKEDILYPSNGFYNKETDSILLEATVMILE